MGDAPFGDLPFADTPPIPLYLDGEFGGFQGTATMLAAPTTGAEDILAGDAELFVYTAKIDTWVLTDRS